MNMNIKPGERTAARGVSQEYRAWQNMKSRCNPTNPASPYYADRGIRVCDRWASSYEAFLEDMGRKPSPELSLDRIDNDRGYEPGNCRWAISSQQMKNRRFLRHARKGESHHNCRLSDQQVMDIRANYILCRVTQRELASRYGISFQHVSRLIAGQQRT